MARLKSDQKAYIVQRLACFDYIADVVKGVKDEFGIDVSRQQVESHDPTKVSGSTLAKKWVTLFEETRKKFIDDTSEIGISHKSVRLRKLERMAAKAEEMNNLVLASSLLEQAAKEVGDSYTNRHKLEHSSPDGSMSPRGRSLEDFYQDADVSAQSKP
jgi:hypothetical protein